MVSYKVRCVYVHMDNLLYRPTVTNNMAVLLWAYLYRNLHACILIEKQFKEVI